jgi:predicted nucleic acid-binding protein
MSRPVLIDSCWYINQARNGHDPLRALSFIAESRDLATCGLITAEVGRGVREKRHLDRYRAAWAVMLFVQSDYKRWDQTLELAWSLDRRGNTLPIQKIHIAACAMHIGAVVLTHDQHFQQIPGLDATDRIF